MKAKKIYEQTEKKSFVYRMQDKDNPLWLNCYDEDAGSYYLQIPLAQANEINEHIKSIVGEQYSLPEEDPQYPGKISTGIKVYDDPNNPNCLFQVLKNNYAPRACQLIDCAVKLYEYSYDPGKGKAPKIGLGKVLIDAKFAERKTSYLVGDDFFDDIDGIDQDAIIVTEKAKDSTDEHDDLLF